MTKKNKKELSRCCIILIFLVIIVGVVGLTWILTITDPLGFYKTEFKITKEDCREQLQIRFKCSDGVGFVDTTGAFEEIYSFETIKGVKCVDDTDMVKICEEVEVEELEFVYRLCDDNGRCLDETDSYHIPKQDLTTEWLDKNCKTECVTYSSGELCKEDIDNDKLVCIGEEVCAGKYVSKYKCGEHKVEVLS